MNDYIEIVENPAVREPWHARIVGGNHEPEWSTENFHREDTARESILRLGRRFSPVQKATVTEHELIVWLDDDELGAKLIVPIRTSEVAAADWSEARIVGGPIQHSDLVSRDIATRDALSAAADDAQRIHQINVTPQRDVSPEDLAWYNAEPQATLRRATSYTVSHSLPGVAVWLRALADRSA